MEMKFCQRWPSQVELDQAAPNGAGLSQTTSRMEAGGEDGPGCQPSSPDSRSTLVVHTGRLVTNTGGRIYSEI